MKKLLLIFGIFSVSLVTTLNCISCDNEDPENRENIVKEIDTYDIGSINKLDDSLVIDTLLSLNPKVNDSHKDELKCDIINFHTAYIWDQKCNAYFFDGFFINFNWKLSNPYEDKGSSILKIDLNKDSNALNLSFDILANNYDLEADGKLDLVIDNSNYRKYNIAESEITQSIDIKNKKYNLSFTWTQNDDPRKENTNLFVRYKTNKKIIYIQAFQIRVVE